MYGTTNHTYLHGMYTCKQLPMSKWHILRHSKLFFSLGAVHKIEHLATMEAIHSLSRLPTSFQTIEKIRTQIVRVEREHTDH